MTAPDHVPSDDELDKMVAAERANGHHPVDDEARRGIVAMAVSPTADICAALLAGESVPLELLNPDMVARYGRRPGAIVTDRLRLADLNTVMVPLVHGEGPLPFALELQDFLEMELERKPPILGTADDTILAVGGLTVLAGMPAVGKTTLTLDLVFHLADGREWLGMPVDRPMNVLLIENEGPQHKFQQKLQAKANAWGGMPQGQIHIQTWKWGAFSFDDSESAERIAHYLQWYEIDLVIGDPLDTLGPRGVGSPEDTRAFVKALVPIGLTADRSFLFLHHMRKEASASEINEVSGAWGGRLDTLLVLKATQAKDELRLSFPKTRWAEERPPVILGKMRDTKSFELLGVEQHEEVDDNSAEAALRQIVSVLNRGGGILERPVLALRCETDPKDRTWQRGLKLGLDRGLLAKEQKGRKMTYSLTEASWET